jgi:hypothetical protein
LKEEIRLAFENAYGLYGRIKMPTKLYFDTGTTAEKTSL